MSRAFTVAWISGVGEEVSAAICVPEVSVRAKTISAWMVFSTSVPESGVSGNSRVGVFAGVIVFDGVPVISSKNRKKLPMITTHIKPKTVSKKRDRARGCTAVL